MFEYGYLDIPQLLLYAFWIFFIGYLIYQRREDKRQGYPLDTERKNIVVQGFPAMPPERPPRAKHPALQAEEPAASTTTPSEETS